jgi:hypothetical protein
MKSPAPGTGTSQVQVTNVDAFGFWLVVRDKEYFLPYEEYPWFRNARIGDLLSVSLSHGHHLRWPALDVDLSVESLERPQDFPLTYRDRTHRGRTAASRRRRHTRRA